MNFSKLSTNTKKVKQKRVSDTFFLVRLLFFPFDNEYGVRPTASPRHILKRKKGKREKILSTNPTIHPYGNILMNSFIQLLLFLLTQHPLVAFYYDVTRRPSFEAIFLTKGGGMKEKDKRMEVATFRFGIIAEFVIGVRLDYGEKAKLLEEKASRTYSIPHSSSSTITTSSIKRWISDYKKAGNRIEGLMPSDRKDKGSFRSLDESIQTAIKEIKKDGNKSSLTGVALEKELKILKKMGENEKINPSVLYRFLKENEFGQEKTIQDRRAFEASSPNEMWQSDVMHGPKVKQRSGKKKSYLIGIMDDCSRLVTHAQFYLSEKIADFKNCLKKAVEKWGLPQKLYVDNGACYKAVNVEQVAACLGIGIAHTPPYTPQGRGKIERWFRTVRDNFLSTCPENLTLDELNERFIDWLEEYHNKIHSSTKQTPLQKYRSNMKCIRPAPPDLIDYFRFIEFRRVKKDRTFRLNGTIFEAPVKLIDRRVELRFHMESPEDVEIFFENKSFGKAVLLDKQVNFKVGRNFKIISTKKEKDIRPGELFQEER